MGNLLRFIFLFFIFSCNGIYSQKDSVFYTFKGVQRQVLEYYSYEATEEMSKDSVEGLYISCNTFTDFPFKILEYKNLKFLQLVHCSTGEAISINKMNKKELENYNRNEKKFYKKYPKGHGTPWFEGGLYSRNKITIVPEELKKLRNLEYFVIGVDISKANLKKLKKMLPETIINCFKDRREIGK